MICSKQLCHIAWVVLGLAALVAGIVLIADDAVAYGCPSGYHEEACSLSDGKVYSCKSGVSCKNRTITNVFIASLILIVSGFFLLCVGICVIFRSMSPPPHEPFV